MVIRRSAATYDQFAPFNKLSSKILSGEKTKSYLEPL